MSLIRKSASPSVGLKTHSRVLYSPLLQAPKKSFESTLLYTLPLDHVARPRLLSLLSSNPSSCNGGYLYFWSCMGSWYWQGENVHWIGTFVASVETSRCLYNLVCMVPCDVCVRFRTSSWTFSLGGSCCRSRCRSQND